MKTIALQLFKLEELSENAKDKALTEHRYINVDYNWWDTIYEDAEQCGLIITGFDFETGYYCNARFAHDALHCAGKIMDDHGDTTNTYEVAIGFWNKRNKLIQNWPKDETQYFLYTGDLDAELDDLEEAFLRDLQWAYHTLLKNEYQFQTADEAVIATIEANEYHFTADGEMATRLEKLALTENQLQ